MLVVDGDGDLADSADTRGVDVDLPVAAVAFPVGDDVVVINGARDLPGNSDTPRVEN